jgi:ABC-type glycerol-3-phosphate transport system permease component
LATASNITIEPPQGTPAWHGPTPRSLMLVKALILTLVVIAVAFPFLSVLATSFASDQDIINARGFLLLPAHPTLDAYRTVLRNGVVLHALWVSVGITVVGTFVSVVVTTLMAYGLAQRRRAVQPLVFMVLFTMLFTPGIIPQYLVVKELGLLNSYAALILPVTISAFNLVVMRQFFMEIPQDLIDSARIDGAGELRVLWMVVLPLSKPVIAVIGLFYAVAYWNAFFHALLYLNDNNSWPLQMIVRMYVLQGVNTGALSMGGEGLPMVAESAQSAVVMLATIPILLVYPFLQRYFTAGVLSGAIKG